MPRSGLGLGVEGWQGCRDGITVPEEFLSWTGNVYNDFPPVNAKLGYRDRAEGRTIKTPCFMLKLFVNYCNSKSVPGFNNNTLKVQH